MAAAAARKLQKEIDTTLKKVEEQRQEFSEVWEEAMNANAAHREKLGEELKRCINKLQRSRVQIREWIAAEKTEQKTMDRLEESRRRIEKDMQRFKEFERELKTKAYSTQALLKEEDMDVLCVEKKQNIEWLIQQLHNLHDLQDEVEADLESLNLTKKEEPRRLELVAHDDRHRWHVEKLERLLRSLQNDEVDMTELAVLKETVEDYIERHKEPDYFHDDNMYDVFSIDEPPVRDSLEAVDTGTPNAAAGAAEFAPGEIPPASVFVANAASGAGEFTGEIPPTSTTKPSVASAGTAAPAIAKKKDSKKKSEKDAKVTTDVPSIEKEVDKKPPAIKEVKIQEDQLVGEAEEFICKICYVHVVGNGPFLTNCSHLFCGDCLTEWFQTHPECQSWAQRAKAAGPQRIVPCPVCKQNLNEKTDLYPVCSTSMRSENLLLWRMLSSLKIMCKNHPKVYPEGRCDWIGEYGTYQAHIQACENKPMALVAKDGKSIGNTNLIREPTNSNQASNASSPAPTFKTIKTDVQVAPSIPIRSSSSTSTSVIEGCEAKSTSAAAKAKAQVSVAQNHAKAKIESVASNVVAAETPSVQHQPVNNILRTVNSSSSNSNIARSQVEAAIKELFSSVASFQPNGKDQIACREGDSIEVLQKHDSGWSYGRVYSTEGTMAEGWFPSWLVGVKIDANARSSQSASIKAEAVEAKPPIQRFPVQNAFSASDASQLSLAIGDLVEVIEQHPTGWTFGRLLSTDKEGWFPDWAGYAGAC